MKRHLLLRYGRSSLHALSALLALGLVTNGMGAQKRPSGPGAKPVSSQNGTFRPLDLSGVYVNSFANYTVQQSWSALPRGLQNFDGVPFQVEGKIEVTGIAAARNGEVLPTRVAGIPIGRKIQRLFLLHGASNTERDGVPVAKLVWHYANGESRSVRITYGVHMRNWYRERAEKKSDLADGNSTVAWNGGSDETDRAEISLRLFKTALENPLPEQELSSIDVVSLFSEATPFIVAMTVEEGGIALPPPAALSRKLRKVHELDDAAYVREFIVQAIDGQDGKPAANALANLTIADDQASFFFGERKADGQGKIVLEYPPQHTVSFNLQVKAPGYIPISFTGSRTNPGDFPREFAAKLERGTPIGGMVQDKTGKPVMGAEVLVCKVVQDSPKQYTQTDYDSVLTGQDGKWLSASVPRNFSGFSFQLAHPDFKPAIYGQAGGNGSSNRQVSAEDLLAHKAVMLIDPGVRLEGIVQDEGQPIPNADIFIENTGRSPKRNLKADGKGRFSFVFPEPGDIALAVLAKGFMPRYESVSLEPGMKPIEVSLSKARPLKGRVVDAEKGPVPGALVRVESWHNTQLLRWRGQTDAEGWFTWDSAPEDGVLYSITKTNYFPLRIESASSGGELSLTMRRMSRVSGKVIDAETKLPIEEFRIFKGRIYSEGEPVRWERYNVTKGRNGQYSIRLEDYFGNNYNNQQTKILIEAPGYIPAASPAYTKAGWYTNDLEMKKGKGISGVVQLSSGEPVANASLVLAETGEYVNVNNSGDVRPNYSNVEQVRTDLQGRFEFSPKLDANTLFVSHPKGFAQMEAEKVAASGKVVLEPWGRVKGVLRVGKKVEPNESVTLQNMYYRYTPSRRQSVTLSVHFNVEPGPDGSFVFEKVPAGERRVYLQYKFRETQNGSNPTPLSHGVPITVKAGETTEVTIGGTGRPIVGQIEIIGGDPGDVDWKRDVHTLVSRLPPIPVIKPPDVSKVTSNEERQKLWREYNESQRNFWTTEEGRALERTQRTYVLVFQTNGAFRVENVPPGAYDLTVAPTDPKQDYYNYQPVGRLNKEVEVPEAPAGHPDEPFDLGSLKLQTRRAVKIGQAAPSFETKTFDGKPVKLEDYRGTNVLLHFWATWGGSSVSELTVLKSIFNTYSNEDRFVILGLNLDHEEKTGGDFVRTNDLKWTQCYLGKWTETQVPALFGVEGIPAVILVDPSGKIIGKNLYGTSIRTAVRNALSSQKRTSLK